jgi:hypothetical protein
MDIFAFDQTDVLRGAAWLSPVGQNASIWSITKVIEEP